MGQTTSAILGGVVERHGAGPQSAWLAQALAGLGTPPAAMKVRIALARAARKLGDELPGLDATERDALPAGPAYAQWSLRDFGRATIVLAACDALPAEAVVAFVEPLVRRGEIGEQVSLLRMAPLLPEPERFVPVMVDACRSNSLDVFEAIACDNPFVAEFFPDNNYNQVVLKALFMDVAVGRIAGLPARVGPELARMATDYADERRAAGRSIPGDVQRIVELVEAKVSQS